MNKILVTGYRYWKDIEKINQALESVMVNPYSDNLVITGKCPYGGADLIAERFAIKVGAFTAGFPADFSRGKWRGPVRNQIMIDVIKPDHVLAFLHPESKGTVACVEYAEFRGYMVHKFWENQ